MNIKLEPYVGKVVECVQRNVKLLEQGQSNFNKSSFVFGLKKIIKNNRKQSTLIVYYKYYNIWRDFDLILDGQPYLQKDYALYIKQSEQLLNYVYIIGGQIDCSTQTDEFSKIPIPKSPHTNDRILKMEKLQNLKQPGVNYLGTSYNNKIFIFHGQQGVFKKKKFVETQLFCKQFFYKGAWYNLNTNVRILPRFDGNSFVVKDEQQGKCLILYGGVYSIPEKKQKENWVDFLQMRGQIFSCSKEQFIGTYFPIDFINYKYSAMLAISTLIFSVPHYGKKQLLISNFNCDSSKGKRQIFSLDWANGDIKLHSIFSTEPLEEFLNKDRQDNEGYVANNIFYTIYFEKKKKSKERLPKLLKINLTTGLFTNQSFIERPKIQKSCKYRIIKQNEY